MPALLFLGIWSRNYCWWQPKKVALDTCCYRTSHGSYTNLHGTSNFNPTPNQIHSVVGSAGIWAHLSQNHELGKLTTNSLSFSSVLKWGPCAETHAFVGSYCIWEAPTLKWDPNARKSWQKHGGFAGFRRQWRPTCFYLKIGWNMGPWCKICEVQQASR